MIASWKSNVRHLLSKKVTKPDSELGQEFLTLQKIEESVGVPNREMLVDFLSDEVSNGTIKIIYKIISPETNAVIAEFEDVLDIPNEIYDDTSGKNFPVDPLSDVEMTFVSQ